MPNVSGGASQADYAVRNSAYTADGRTLPLALDIEYNPYGAECYGLSAAQMVSWLSAFTAEVQRVTGQRPEIYTTADWWRTCTGDSTAFGSDPLWVAAYQSASPPMPAGWANWTFWQYTSQGSVPGITAGVDVSYFLRAAVRLLDPGNASASASPSPSPSPASSASSSSSGSSSSSQDPSPSSSPSSADPSPSPSSSSADPSPSASPSSSSADPSPSASPSSSSADPSPSPSSSSADSSPSSATSPSPSSSASPSASASPSPSTESSPTGAAPSASATDAAPSASP